jgi:hypothetical protein
MPLFRSKFDQRGKLLGLANSAHLSEMDDVTTNGGELVNNAAFHFIFASLA